MKVENKEISIISPDGSRKTALVYRFTIIDFNLLKSKIDQYIIDLMFGDNERSFDTARYCMKQFLSRKSSSQKLGIVSELLMHLSTMEFNAVRYNLIKNLEDSSMKKGFDGVYVLNSELWFGESKSSADVNFKHISNINESMKCFANKVNGRNKNNPWENALAHINVLRNCTLMDETLKKKITILADNYYKNIYYDSRDFNIIPSSTLIVNDQQTFDEICEDCRQRLPDFNYRKIIIVCINNSLYEKTLNYLEMKNE